MNKFLLSAIFAVVLLSSCTIFRGKQVLNFSQEPGTAEAPEAFTITDYKDKTSGASIPEWAELWLNSENSESGIHAIEALDAYRDRYVFISRNIGNNFNALTQWSKGFSPEQDFPRFAAARIEARLSNSVPFPDNEYGAFYETLVRTAADASWYGAVRVDDFWIHREFRAGSGEDGEPSGANEPNTQENLTSSPAREVWEFLILVTIDRTLFASQLDDIFRNMDLKPVPSRDQAAAVNKVKDHFFEGF